jgi:penicillin-binding protein 1C
MRRYLNGLALALAALALAILAADRLFPLDLSRYQDRSLEVLDRDGEALRRFTTEDGMLRLLTTPDSVDPRYLALLLETEDRRFWSHPGVDPLALARAAWQLARSGHVVSGGSTLTMQVARLLEPHPHDLGGKLADIARALQLEAHLGKREILTMYLTLAPMGGNLEGVRAASLSYFGHEPRLLSPAQMALLVAIPQSPTRLSPDRHLARAERAARRILARAMPLEAGGSPAVSRHPSPMHAPHLADRLRAGGAGDVARTTLDGALQRALEDLVTRERTWVGADANMAILVVANRDRSVLAYVGGNDYFGSSGMVDMIRAKRSPGSTLKPFIYGLALDDDIITPETIIDDGPVQFGDYAPQNFDRVFHGPVTARQALQQSLNSPAVQLLGEVGPARFAASLRMAGAGLAFPDDAAAPGLPIALGGVGIDLGDLVMLYAALADAGRTAGLRFAPDAPAQVAAALMTDTAARQVEEMLQGVAPPDGVAPARPRRIAYKTGTSYGFRDALAIGSSGDYTIGVWVGRTEGTPRPGAYGRNTAAPLLFRVFDLLPADTAAPSPAALSPAQAGRPLQAAALRRFGQAIGFHTAKPSAASLRIVFPPPGARIELAQPGSAAAPLALEAAGGVPPYRWAVNGRPLPPAAPGAGMSWRPEGPGFATVSVTDSVQRTTVAEFRLSP